MATIEDLVTFLLVGHYFGLLKIPFLTFLIVQILKIVAFSGAKNIATNVVLIHYFRL